MGAGSVQVAERVLPACPLRAQEGQRQLDHLVVQARPQGLQVRGDPEIAEPAYVVGVHQLEVGDVMPAPGGVVQRGERVQRLSHAAVPDAMNMHLEALGVEPGDVRLERLRVDEGVAAVAGRVAVRCRGTAR